jgi:gag-polyprotein putative aspartyl protease
MPSKHGVHDGRAATLAIAIVDAARYNEHKQSADPVFQGAKPFKALIDTGATTTMIAPRVVKALGLQQVNVLEFGHLNGLSRRPGYLFHVAFFPPATPSEISKLQVMTKVINGGELLDEHTFDVLLGMDVLTTGDLYIGKAGTFRFSF